MHCPDHERDTIEPPPPPGWAEPNEKELELMLIQEIESLPEDIPDFAHVAIRMAAVLITKARKTDKNAVARFLHSLA